MTRKPSTVMAWRLCAATLVTIGWTQAAFADWRYCYAVAPAQHRFYMSAPFQIPQNQATSGIEASFRQTVQRQDVRTESVACPRGADRDEIGERMRHAADYNRSSGNVVVPLDWSQTTSTGF